MMCWMPFDAIQVRQTNNTTDVHSYQSTMTLTQFFSGFSAEYWLPFNGVAWYQSWTFQATTLTCFKSSFNQILTRGGVSKLGDNYQDADEGDGNGR